MKLSLKFALALNLTAALTAGPAFAQAPAPAFELPPEGDTTPVDYSQPAMWLCGPDAAGDLCSTGLDAAVPGKAGKDAVEAFQAAAQPPVDCFYVYPTISADPTLHSDLSPDGEKDVVRDQLGRLSKVCRTFAPLYRQLTQGGMIPLLDMDPGTTSLALKAPEVMDLPYRDVRDAWNYYLAHYNHGRGVVLISHSQGSMHMKRLIADEIDGKPAQKLLVAAYLAGSLNLDSSSFAHINPCTTGTQTGCLVAWSSYRDTQLAGWRMMGRAAPGTEPVCVNPAGLDGSDGKLDAYVNIVDRKDGDPRYARLSGQMTAACVTDARGGVLSVHYEDGSDAGRVTNRALTQYGEMPDLIGMHDLDIALVQGNIMNLVAKQSAAWVAMHAKTDHTQN